jgi:hypothetical protein
MFGFLVGCVEDGFVDGLHARRQQNIKITIGCKWRKRFILLCVSLQLHISLLKEIMSFAFGLAAV